MVDNRSAGFYGIGGGFNFKSGDISGTAAKTADDRASQGTEYFAQEENQKFENPDEFYVDRSAQLRASLSSLAMINLSRVLRNLKTFDEKKNKKDEGEADFHEHDDFEQEFSQENSQDNRENSEKKSAHNDEDYEVYID